METDRIDGIVGVAFLAVLALGLAAAVPGLDPPAPEGLLDGRWASAFEAELDEGFDAREAAVTGWTVVEWALFRDGRDGVVVGSSGWLFTDEEFERHPHEAERREEQIRRVLDVAEGLRAKGIPLVVAVVPAKARIVSDELGGLTWPPHAAERLEVLTTALREAGVAAPDLVAPLAEAEAAATGPDDHVFLRTDTHWSPKGSRIVAEVVAQAVRDLELDAGLGADGWKAVPQEPVRHEGDLLNYLPLGPWQDALGPEPDTLISIDAEAPPADPMDLFGDRAVPVTLVGTSYSANEAFGFADALRVALGAEVINAAKDGRGPLEPMEDYLANPALDEAPPSVVVWEFPERYLGWQPPPTGGA